MVFPMTKVTLKADHLRKILARKNKSQNWLAYRMEISSGYISQLINGARYPSPRMRERFLQALEGTTFDDLFEIEGMDGRKRKPR